MNANFYQIAVNSLCYAGIAGVTSENNNVKISPQAAAICSVAGHLIFLALANTVVDDNPIIKVACSVIGGTAIANLAGYKFSAKDAISLLSTRIVAEVAFNYITKKGYI